MVEPPLRRDDLRAVGIEVPSLAEVELKLIEAQIAYTRHRGLLPGEESIALNDPAGNGLALFDMKPV